MIKLDGSTLKIKDDIVVESIRRLRITNFRRPPVLLFSQIVSLVMDSFRGKIEINRIADKN